MLQPSNYYAKLTPGSIGPAVNKKEGTESETSEFKKKLSWNPLSFFSKSLSHNCTLPKTIQNML